MIAEFREYAAWYDLLYKDKDYLNESFYIRNLLNRYASGAVNRLMEIGCGTGNHAQHLASIGYQVTGTDLSGEMIGIAKEKWKENPRLRFIQGHSNDLNLGEVFDGIISLFHVMSYVKSHNDLSASFETAFRHLRAGGVFIFDFWYGPAVLHDLPVSRERTVQGDGLSITRKATPTLFTNQDLVNVHYDLEIRKHGEETRHVSEDHKVRYLFLPELEYLLAREGFSVEVALQWMDLEKEPDRDHWYACMVARKPT